MIEEVAKDLYRIEIPLPEYFPKSVNSYVLKDEKRSLIIDAGLKDDGCMLSMQQDLKKLGLDLTRTDFFLTHGHSDHVGLVPSLIRDGSILYLSKPEADFIQRTESGELVSEIQAFYQMSGSPEGVFEMIAERFTRHYFKSGHMPRFEYLHDQDRLSRADYSFICIETPGHNKGHMCLYEPEKEMLISGDHILEDVVPPVVGRTNKDNPLKEYLSSLDKLLTLDIERVLPGHGKPFQFSQKRIEATKKHHLGENLRVLSILGKGSKSIYETAVGMNPKLQVGSLTPSFAIQSFLGSEDAFVRLRYLEEEGRVAQTTQGKVLIYSLRENG